MPICRGRIGTEHEKLAVCVGSRERAPHAKIAHILSGLVDRHGWEAMTEGSNIIGAEVLTCVCAGKLGNRALYLQISINIWVHMRARGSYSRNGCPEIPAISDGSGYC